MTVKRELDPWVVASPRDGQKFAIPCFEDQHGHVVVDFLNKRPLAGHTTRDAVSHRTRDAVRQRLSRLERTMRSFDETSSGNVSLGRSNYAEPDHEDTEAGEEIASYHERDYSVTRDRGGVYRVRRRRQARRDRREETGRTDDADRSPTAIMTLDGTARDSHPAALTKLGDYLNSFWEAKKGKAS
jgi:hypothetical protein